MPRNPEFIVEIGRSHPAPYRQVACSPAMADTLERLASEAGLGVVVRKSDSFGGTARWLRDMAASK